MAGNTAERTQTLVPADTSGILIVVSLVIALSPTLPCHMSAGVKSFALSASLAGVLSDVR